MTSNTSVLSPGSEHLTSWRTEAFQVQGLANTFSAEKFQECLQFKVHNSAYLSGQFKSGPLHSILNCQFCFHSSTGPLSIKCSIWSIGINVNMAGSLTTLLTLIILTLPWAYPIETCQEWNSIYLEKTFMVLLHYK